VPQQLERYNIVGMTPEIITVQVVVTWQWFTSPSSLLETCHQDDRVPVFLRNSDHFQGKETQSLFIDLSD
jgi:hypothetical protein